MALVGVGKQTGKASKISFGIMHTFMVNYEDYDYVLSYELYNILPIRT